MDIRYSTNPNDVKRYTTEAQVSNLVARIEADLSGVDILVNNAGIIKRIPMTEMSAEDFRQVVDIDLVGPFI